MATLSSTDTLAQVQAAYADSASYVEDNSVAKCRAFITACTILLLKLPAEQGTREAQLRLNPDLVQKQMERAQTWLENHDTGTNGSTTPAAGPRVTRVRFEC